MAIPNNFLHTYTVGPSAGGANREDLINLITMIDPWDTPFFTAAPKTTAKLIRHEWLTDALAATATAGKDEGRDFSAEALTSRTRLFNITQIFGKDIAVTDTQRAVDPAGIRDEYEHQVMKGMREVARNVEARIWALPGASATGASSAVRVMKAFADFLDGDANVTVTASSTLTTAMVNTGMEKAYSNGGNPDTLYVSPGVKSDFSAAAVPTQFTRNLAAADKKLVMNVDVYESDFGLLAVIPDRWMPQGATATASAAAYLVERAKARVAILRPIKHVPIAKGGDATRGQITGELTLEVLHPSAHIRISGITT